MSAYKASSVNHPQGRISKWKNAGKMQRTCLITAIIFRGGSVRQMTWSFTCKLTHTKRSLLVCVSLHVNDQVISPQPSATDLLITLNLPEYSQIPILILKFTHGWLHIGDIVYIRHEVYFSHKTVRDLPV